MGFTLTRDAERFAALTKSLWYERVECNALATILDNVLDGRYTDRAPLFAYASDADQRVIGAALRTPPWPMITSELDPSAAAELLALWRDEDPQLPGVNGPARTARAIALQWTALTGRGTSLRTRMAMHQLRDLTVAPHPAPGYLRSARSADRPLLLDWWQGFARDAGVISGDTTALDSRLEHGGMFVWEHDRPVSMVGLTRPVAGVVRIAPVYTPPSLRRRGYAGSATAAASRHALNAGVRTVILFTDLANPTANKIYAEIGYGRIADWEEYEFESTVPGACAHA